MEEETKTKKVFLEDLPRKNGKSNRIDWEKSIGYKIKGIYEGTEIEVKIIDYILEKRELIIEYNNEEFNIKSNNFAYCKLGNIIGAKTSKFKIKIGTHYKDDKRDITIIEQKNIKGKGKCYKYHCNICGFNCGEHYKNQQFKKELWIREPNLLSGTGCESCCNHIVIY